MNNMNKIKLAAIAALVGVSSVAMAEDGSSDSARQERMDRALQDYRGSSDASASSTTPSKGRFARAEDSVKSGFHRAGEAIEGGAKKVGHAVSNGVHKTGDAIHRTGEKIKSKTSSDQ
jgi:hypothetical protein